jgi:hypothetical protein
MGHLETFWDIQANPLMREQNSYYRLQQHIVLSQARYAHTMSDVQQSFTECLEYMYV